MQRILRVTSLLVISSAAIASIGMLGETAKAQRAPANAPANQTQYHHDIFVTSDNCIACHSNTIDERGNDVSIGYAWRASMMANSARDPYWHAAVRRETMDHPQLKSAIEDKCATCHMPMARYTAKAAGGFGEVLSHIAAQTGAPAGAGALPLTPLAMDGVSCTTCHQIKSDNFGTELSFDGGFEIAKPAANDQRIIVGKYDIDAGRTSVMRSASGYEPARSDILQKSELCATCHTLFTQSYDSSGQPGAVLPEQVPYLEWRNSSYAETKSCQSCHMPKVAGQAQIASVLGEGRSDVSEHIFLGGNAFMMRIFAAHRDALGVPATRDELEKAAKRTEQHLATDAANLTITQMALADGVLSFRVNVRNLAGHKLPTAYPSRRAWLHVSVFDPAGREVFSSGSPRPDGSIEGNDNDADGATFEPHYDIITSGEQVQIYEPVMATAEGAVTTGLLRGARYVKDNRILPDGFDKAIAPDDVAVRGAATADSTFVAGGDSVGYRISADPSAGDWRIEARLYYQSIGYRWAQNLKDYDAAEPKRFVSMYDGQAARSHLLLARTSGSIRGESRPIPE